MRQKSLFSQILSAAVLTITSFLFISLSNTCQAETPTTLVIVSSLPRTGSANAQSTSIANGIRLALQEIDHKVGTVTIDYQDWDDSSPARGNWDPSVEATNADKAVQDPRVVAYIGPYNSGAAKISMPKTNLAGLAQISPAATWPGLTKPLLGEPNEPAIYRPTGKINFFRVVPADDLQGDVGAKWAHELDVKKVFILHDGELYGKGVASVFKKSAEKLGLSVLGFDKIDPKASNFRSLAVRIKQGSPDMIYFGGTTQTGAGQLAKDLRSAGVNSKLMVPDGCFENAFIESAGREALEGNVYVTFGGVPANELKGNGKIFYDTYKKAFNAEPEGYAAYGYESAKVVLDAIKRSASPDRAAIVTAISQTKDFPGALGTWSFDSNGDTTLRSMSGSTVKNGQFALVKILD